MGIEESWKVAPPTHVESTARHIRVRAGEEVIADSERALLLSWYGPGRLPTYALPARDVRTELLRPSPGSPGDDVAMIDHDVHLGDRVLERSAHLLDKVPPEARRVEGYWTFPWGGAVQWFEEALEVQTHARDPRHRVDAIPSDRHVRVELGGEVIADSTRPVALFETHLPTRWYFPPDDVRMGNLVPTDTLSTCPYKGHAHYWSVQAGGQEVDDLAWAYEDVYDDGPARIRGLVAFFNEKVDMVVDGVRVARPVTPWS